METAATQPAVVTSVGELIGERPRFGQHTSPNGASYLAPQGLLALQIQSAGQVQVGRELPSSRLVSGLP
jgi:hypothetical protein